jgi:cytoskeletal protein RodZ
MAESLGEKLRLAREARGITISEVSAQTRIATRYLEAIEENNYKPLPGGVFNKGFIKAYAKYVGVDEQEALSDYARIMAVHAESEDEGYKRPTVMTDDSRRSSWSSMIFAVIILVLLTGGVLLLVQWYRSAPVEQVKNPPANNSNNKANTNAAVNASETPAPAVDQIKVELKSVVPTGTAVTTWVDETKETATVMPAAPKTYTPQNSFRIAYSKYHAENIQLVLNGKTIQLPLKPLNASDSVIKFEITKANAGQIMQSGQITLGSEVPVATPADANTNVAVDTTNTAVVLPTTTTPRVTPKPVVTPTKTPAAANTNTAAPVNKVTISIPTAKTPVPRPAATPTPKRP